MIKKIIAEGTPLNKKVNELIDAVNSLTSKEVEGVRWMPLIEERYYSFYSDGKIDSNTWRGDRFDHDRYNFNNVHETEEKCIAARDAVRNLLKGL